METNFTLTVLTCVFMNSQVHDLEVEHTGLCLGIKNFDSNGAIHRLELFCTESGHFLVNFDVTCTISDRIFQELSIKIQPVLVLKILSF